jgi:hypothetical protein
MAPRAMRAMGRLPSGKNTALHCCPSSRMEKKMRRFCPTVSQSDARLV